MRYIFALILALLPIGASAQSDGGEGARAAAALLSDASLQLDKADSARDRVKALTQTIRAYEAGLTQCDPDCEKPQSAKTSCHDN